MPELLITTGPEATGPLRQKLVDSFTVGRAQECDFTFPDRHLSRLHCRFQLDDQGRWIVIDNASTNGTRLDGVRVQRQVLRDGDVLRAGPVQMTFVATEVVRLEAAGGQTSLVRATPIVATPLSSSGNETILDGVIIASFAAARLPTTTRKSPPRLRPTLLTSMRGSNRPGKEAVCIADLSQELVVRQSSDASGHNDAPASDRHPHWRHAIAAVFGRRRSGVR